ncbi:galactosyltransferase-related protein [Xenophilus arseniciresistens]|uniref:Galactosyltransferase-related protein n=1 Tax=Xenophilus arseniciresistens TaxID=1283306 RepID=A0AAE3NBX7_9BURK|nr:glycosyltransferase family 2 protein [Xenophilus arseniciresistens]MDA7418743.1 galactosyltransferase-related protein [Xenophilus arseniciresistens]
MSTPAPPQPWLSIVLPFWRKLREFEQVLPLNAPWWAREGIEVVIALDDAADEQALGALLARFAAVRWVLVVNDQPHDWRPPCRAINAGVRQATGRFVLVHSPESAYVGDAPALALQAALSQPRAVALGRVGFARFDELAAGPGQPQQALQALFDARVPEAPYLRTFYGSLCCAREAFEAVGGYDESFAEWGGDDDDLRVRLEMAGWQLLACTALRLLHLSFEPRDGGEHYDPALDWQRCTPEVAHANGAPQHAHWGRDFSRLARRDAVPSTEALPGWAGPPPAPQPLLPMGSRRQCELCARLLHHERAPRFFCPRCSDAQVPRPLTAPPRIVCVVQVRNQAGWLAGCLAHLRAHVDGFVILDDGSSDETAQVAQREPRLLELLRNEPQEPHVWDERENRRRLLECAQRHGAAWVLPCDADERCETLFLTHLRAIVDSLPQDRLVGLSLDCCECWDAPDRIRIDGLWGRKSRVNLFRLPREIRFDAAPALHGPWYPDVFTREGEVLVSHYRFYHLGAMQQAQRLARRARYRQLDPQRRFQAVGYDYLAQEGASLRLAPIAPWRGYEMASLPLEIASLRAKSPR